MNYDFRVVKIFYEEMLERWETAEDIQHKFYFSAVLNTILPNETSEDSNVLL